MYIYLYVIMSYIKVNAIDGWQAQEHEWFEVSGRGDAEDVDGVEVLGILVVVVVVDVVVTDLSINFIAPELGEVRPVAGTAAQAAGRVVRAVPSLGLLAQPEQ